MFSFRIEANLPSPNDFSAAGVSEFEGTGKGSFQRDRAASNFADNENCGKTG